MVNEQHIVHVHMLPEKHEQLAPSTGMMGLIFAINICKEVEHTLTHA